MVGAVVLLPLRPAKPPGAYGCKANLPGETAQGSRAEALKQAVNSCKEQIQERHREQAGCFWWVQVLCFSSMKIHEKVG